MIIEETIGQKDAWHYRMLLETFYEDPAMLSHRISEVAATAGAMKELNP